MTMNRNFLGKNQQLSVISNFRTPDLIKKEKSFKI